MKFSMENKTILMADDDIDDTEMFCEALEDLSEDIICHCAINGNEVIEILRNLAEKPQLIFLDLNMPVMNGWECVKLLKEDDLHKDIPVIMISTSSHKNDIETALNSGAIGYLVKPNNFNDLKIVLHSITSNLGKDLKEAIFNLQANGQNHIYTK